MGFTVKQGEVGGFDPVAEGAHMAVCSGVIDLGHQFNAKFNKWGRKALFQFQLADEMYEKDGVKERRVISKRVGVSFHPKATMLQFLQAWRGKALTAKELNEGFDLKACLGAAALLNIVHQEKTGGGKFANIASIMPVPKGTEKPKMQGEFTWFSWEESAKGEDIETLPEWIQKILMESREYKSQFEPVGKNQEPTEAAAEPEEEEF